MSTTKIPSATILRLSIYQNYLKGLMDAGTSVISSKELARQTNVNPAQLRKDLSYFGRFGVRGVGYDVSKLLTNIKGILHRNTTRDMILVGANCIGLALLEHKQFEKNGYSFVAVFDPDTDNQGKKVAGEYVVAPVEGLSTTVKERGVELGVLAVEQEKAQQVADMMVEAGIRGILNFTPCRLKVPGHVAVQYVDFTVLLDTLSYAVSSAMEQCQAGTRKKETQSWDRNHAWPALQFQFQSHS